MMELMWYRLGYAMQVEHNLAVVEFLRGECKQPQVLVEALRSVKVGWASLPVVDGGPARVTPP
jgi:hypothetical protein